MRQKGIFQMKTFPLVAIAFLVSLAGGTQQVKAQNYKVL
jgi:hypothetical protein